MAVEFDRAFRIWGAGAGTRDRVIETVSSVGTRSMQPHVIINPDNSSDALVVFSRAETSELSALSFKDAFSIAQRQAHASTPRADVNRKTTESIYRVTSPKPRFGMFAFR